MDVSEYIFIRESVPKLRIKNATAKLLWLLVTIFPLKIPPKNYIYVDIDTFHSQFTSSVLILSKETITVFSKDFLN